MIVPGLEKLMFSTPILPVVVKTIDDNLNSVLNKVVSNNLDMISKSMIGKWFMPLPTLSIPMFPMPSSFPIPFFRNISKTFNMFNLLASAKDIESLESIDGVDKIYPDRMFQITETPQLTNNFITSLEVFPKLEINKAHEAGITGKGVTVAVLDTGVNNTHQGLQGKVNSLAVMPHPPQVDFNGHGSHCISDVCATLHKNHRGMWCGGIAPDVNMIAIKVLGFGIGTGTTMGIIEGIDIAIEHGAKVISMSLGSDGVKEEDSALAQTINRVSANGTIVVVANGNSGPDSETVGTPACAKDAISVGSVRFDNEKVSEFSSRGPSPDGYIKPDISCLGGDSIDPKEFMYNGTSAGSLLDGINDKLQDSYAGLMGTSMSCPKLAAIIALWLQTHDLNKDDVLKIFAANGHEKNNNDGHGLIKYTWIEGM